MNPPNSPPVTVVVATHNRSDFLSEMIAALRSQSYEFFQVVVVNDGSSDDTPNLLAQLIDGDTRFQVIHQKQGGPASARNRGANEATGEWLLFTDDDCIAEPNWITALVNHAEHTTADVIQGMTVPDRRVAPNDTPLFGRSIHIGSWSGRFQTCNLLVRTKQFVQINGFREDFPPGALGEDTDLGLRLVAIGATTSYCSEGITNHRWIPMSYPQFLRRRIYWAEAVRLVSLNPKARTIFPHRYVAFRDHVLFWLSLFVGIPLVVVGFWLTVPIGFAGWIALQLRRTRDSKQSLRRRLLRAVGALPALAVSSTSFIVKSIRYRTLLL